MSFVPPNNTRRIRPQEIIDFNRDLHDTSVLSIQTETKGVPGTFYQEQIESNSLKEMLPVTMNQLLTENSPMKSSKFSMYPPTPNFSLGLSQNMGNASQSPSFKILEKVLFTQFDDIGATERMVIDHISSEDEKREEEIKGLQRRMESLFRENQLLLTDNKQLWRLYNSIS